MGATFAEARGWCCAFPCRERWPGSATWTASYCPVDSNWADCRETRRSTSGGALVHGKHTLATWSVTQAIQALSSGEAEYYALLRGAVEALGLAATAEELGFTFRWVPRLGSDSNAARGAAGRHGLGKLKHLELKFLWLQATLRQGRLVLVRQPGEENFVTPSLNTLRRRSCDNTWREGAWNCGREGPTARRN